MEGNSNRVLTVWNTATAFGLAPWTFAVATRSINDRAWVSNPRNHSVIKNVMSTPKIAVA